MTALDQAFIKAYFQHGALPPALAPKVRPVPLSEMLDESPQAPAGEPPQSQGLAMARALQDSSDSGVGLPHAGALRVLRQPPDRNGKGHTTMAPHATSPRDERRELQPGSSDRGADAPARVSVADLGIPQGVACFIAPSPTLPVLKKREPARFRPERPATSERPALPGIEPPPSAPDAAGPPSPPSEPSAPETAADAPPPPAVVVPMVEPFRALLQTDRFGWPAVCEVLRTKAGAALERLADVLEDAGSQGRRLVAMGALRRDEGCTTLLLATARVLSRRGLRVALVEADAARPALAGRLGLAPEIGWEAVAAGRTQLPEVVIESLADRIALVPWCKPSAGMASVETLPGLDLLCLVPLRSGYDLALVDLGPMRDRGPLSVPSGPSTPTALEGLLLVRNVRSTSLDDLIAIRDAAASHGISLLGIAENCVPEVRAA